MPSRKNGLAEPEQGDWAQEKSEHQAPYHLLVSALEGWGGVQEVINLPQLVEVILKKIIKIR